MKRQIEEEGFLKNWRLDPGGQVSKQYKLTQKKKQWGGNYQRNSTRSHPGTKGPESRDCKDLLSAQLNE